MTRVNAIPVEELTDQHLIAEYREITMVPASLNRTLSSKKGLNKKRISEAYTLNSGHVYFFYDKGQFLRDRYRQIVREMRRRGFSPDKSRSFPVKVFRDNSLFGRWSPDDSAASISRKRIEEKVSMKPAWYRKTPYKNS